MVVLGMCFGTVLSLTHPMHKPSLSISISRLGALFSGLVAALSFAASAQSSPATPSGLTAAPLDAQAVLSWTNPSDSTITGYSVRVATSATILGSISWTAIPGSTATSTTHTVPSLVNGLRYYFQIRAHNAVGHGTESAAATIQLAASPSAPVTIRDSSLRTALEAEIGSATITQLDMAKLRELELENKDISVLAGLEHAVNIRSLDLDRNAISDVTALGSLTQLSTLSLDLNAISDLTALGSLTQLSTLSLDLNAISDLTALGSLTQLGSLSLSENAISDVTALGSLAGLRSLDLSRNVVIQLGPHGREYRDGNTISDVTALGSLTQLVNLSLDGNAISDITALGSLTQLDHLDLDGNAISDITALRSLNLAQLDLDENAISDLTALHGMTRLITLSLDRNGISDVTALRSLTRLTRLSLNGNAIADITALSSLTQLDHLDLDGNAIADITTLRSLTRLTRLSLAGNAISDLTALGGLTALTSLSLGNAWSSLGNAISDVTALGSLTSLTSLSLDENAISDLTALSGLTSLTRLSLNGNVIADVTALGSLTSLTSLSLDENAISDLMALSGLTSLTRLSLNGNVIADVTALVNLTSLTQLWLYANPLSAASIHTHIPVIESRGTTVGFQVLTQVPQSPYYLTATAGEGSVTLRWRDPGDPYISRYEVRYRSTCLASFSEWAPIAGSHSRTVDHVWSAPGNPVHVEFELRAVNVVGAGYSSSANVGPPRILHTTLGDAEVSLSWYALLWDTAPLGSMSYSIRYTTGDWADLTSVAWIPVVADVSSVCRRAYMVSGLANGTRYWFQIRATNAAGRSRSLSRVTTRLAASPSAVVDISDSNLRTALEAKTGKAAGATITQLDMAELRGRLGLESKGISVLTGLEHAVNIRELDLEANAISDLTALGSLTQLRGLDLRGNKISDVTALGGLTQLGGLNLRGNKISDVAALGNLTGLRSLSLVSNTISDVTALGDLTQLERLYLGSNAISDVTALSDLTRLEWLDLSDNAIFDVTALALNLGLDEGYWARFAPEPERDLVDLSANPLSAASINVHIPAILARGARVWFNPLPTSTPSAPTHLTANAGEGRVTLRWADPLDAYVDRYELRHGAGQPPAFGQWLAIAGSNRRTTEHVVPAASDGRHTFELRAVNFVGAGAAASVQVLLLFEDSLRMPLGSIFAAGGGLSFRATSSDESVATVRVIDGELVVAPAYAGDGTTQIQVVATDATGRSTEVRFNVRVEFIWPMRPTGGWRSALLMLE